MVSNKPEFNNGFVTAFALFYGHKHQNLEASQVIDHDMRIYGASDHLFDLELPKDLPNKIKKQYEAFVQKVFAVRLKDITIEYADEIFDECLAIIKAIDEHYFVKKVVVNYK